MMYGIAKRVSRCLRQDRWDEDEIWLCGKGDVAGPLDVFAVHCEELDEVRLKYKAEIRNAFNLLWYWSEKFASKPIF